jgi:hypothetical protein
MDPGPISLVNSMPPTSHRIASSLNYLVKVLQQIQDTASNLLLVQPCRTGITPYRSDSGCWAGNSGCDEGAASSYADHRSSAGTRLRGKSCSAEESGAEHDEGRCVGECVGAMAVAVAISMFPSLSLMRHGYSRLPSFQSESAPRIGRASRSTDMFTSPSAHPTHTVSNIFTRFCCSLYVDQLELSSSSVFQLGQRTEQPRTIHIHTSLLDVQMTYYRFDTFHGVTGCGCDTSSGQMRALRR